MSYALRCSLQVIARFISLPLIWSYAKPSCQWGLDPSSLGYIYSTFLALQIAATQSRLVQHKIATFGNSFNFLIQLFLLSMDHPILPVFVDFLLTSFQLLFAAIAVNHALLQLLNNGYPPFLSFALCSSFPTGIGFTYIVTFVLLHFLCFADFPSQLVNTLSLLSPIFSSSYTHILTNSSCPQLV